MKTTHLNQKCPRSTFHFSPFISFNSCLHVILQLKGDYTENSHDKQCSFEPFMCLDLVLERYQSLLFRIFFVLGVLVFGVELKGEPLHFHNKIVKEQLNFHLW